VIGVLHTPSAPSSIGVVIVVGGPQYRVGSHRQFVLMARDLAARGLAVLRFDCRGMGDSAGEFPGFEHIEPDVGAAAEFFMARIPSLRQLVLWGLCDATFAICSHARKNPHVRGVALINPWVRTETGLARVRLKHYYLKRLVEREFLRKVATGDFDMLRSGRALLANLVHATTLIRWRRSPLTDGVAENYLAERMATNLRHYKGRILLIISGQDLTAREFEDAARSSKTWRQIYADTRTTRHELREADHTFSRRAWRDQVAAWTWEWIEKV